MKAPLHPNGGLTRSSTAMHRPTRTRLPRPALQWVVWCLLFALPVFGLSSAAVGMLGASHHHTEAQRSASVMLGWQDFRRTAHAPPSEPAKHSHAALLRHHHAEGDASVVALDGDAGDALQGEAAPVTLMFAIGEPAATRHAEPVAVRWPGAAPGAIQSAHARRLERPPQG